MPILQTIARALPTKLLGPGIVALAIKMVGAVLAYAMIVVLARMMSQDEYGRFAFGLNLSIIAATIGGLGIATAILRYWPQYLAKEDWAGARGVVALGYRACFAGGILMLVAAFLFAVLTGIYSGQTQIAEYLSIALLGLTISLGDYSTNLLRAQGSTLVSMLPRDVLWRIFTILGATLVTWLGYKITGSSALIICTGVLAALTLWQYGHVSRQISQQVLPVASRKIWNEIRPSLIPLWASSVVFAMIQQFDVVIIGTLMGNAQAGAYFAAQKTAALLSLVLIAAGLVAAPSMSRLYHSGKSEELQQLCKNLSAAIVVVSIIGFTILALAGKKLLALFDPSYVAAYPILLIVAAGTMIDAISGPNAYLMQMTSFEKHYLKIMAVCYAGVLVAQIILVPLMGGIGAALASAGGVIIWNVWSIAILRSKAGLDPSLLCLIIPPRKSK